MDAIFFHFPPSNELQHNYRAIALQLWCPGFNLDLYYHLHTFATHFLASSPVPSMFKHLLTEQSSLYILKQDLQLIQRFHFPIFKENEIFRCATSIPTFNVIFSCKLNLQLQKISINSVISRALTIPRIVLQWNVFGSNVFLDAKYYIGFVAQ